MVAGFGSRLREKIESTRPAPQWGPGGGGGGTSLSSSGHHGTSAANIRGLTRLGGSTASSAASGGKAAPGGAGAAGGGAAGGTAGRIASAGTTARFASGAATAGSSVSSRAGTTTGNVVTPPPSGGLLSGRIGTTGGSAVATSAGSGENSAATANTSSSTSTSGAGGTKRADGSSSQQPEHTISSSTASTAATATSTSLGNLSNSSTVTGTRGIGTGTGGGPTKLSTTMPALGGSKIVPGWGAGLLSSSTSTSTTTTNLHAPSGHLVGLQTASGGAPSTFANTTTPRSNSSTSRRRRWGDYDEEEEDSDEFPNLASSLEGANKKKVQLQQDVSTASVSATTSAAAATSNYRENFIGSSQNSGSSRWQHANVGVGGGIGDIGSSQSSGSRWQHGHVGGGGGGNAPYRPSSGGGGGGGIGDSGRFYTGEYDRHDSWRNNDSRTASSSAGGFHYSSSRDNTTPTNRASGNIYGGGHYSDRGGGGGGGGGGFSSSSYYDNGHYREPRDNNRDSWSKSRVHNWRSSSSSEYDDTKHSSSNWRSGSSSLQNDESATGNRDGSNSLWSFNQREHLHFSGSSGTRRSSTEEGGGGRFDRDGERGGNNHSFFSSSQGNKASDVAVERENGTISSGAAASLSAMVDRSNQLGPATNAATTTTTLRDEALSTRRPQVASDPSSIVRQSTTPMVLLRSSYGNNSGSQTPTELPSKFTEATNTRSVDGASEVNHGVPSTELGNLESYPPLRGGSSQPPNAWGSLAATTTLAPDNRSLDLLQEKSKEVPAESSVATIARITPSSTQTTPKDTEQDKVELAKEQQLNILRQVAERRAAATKSSNKSEVKEKKRRIELEKKPSSVENGEVKDDIKRTESTTTEDQIPVRKGRFDMDRTDTKSNPKSESLKKGVKAKSKPKLNPCRIEGHDHQWSDCPQNPKSDKFVRDNPCRIEGHDHDWNDCPDNPKSDNFKPTYKKGKSRGPNGDAKDAPAVSDGASEKKGNPCRNEGHDHDWNDCPNNPKSINYVKPTYKKGKGRDPKSVGNTTDTPAASDGASRKKGNPCRNEGHDHDWKDCPNNPKSVNYVKPTHKKGKSRGPSASEENGLSDLKDEVCKAGDNKQEVVGEPMKELAEPTDQKETPAKPKPFVPAPPPAVPAWTKANPLTIASQLPATKVELSNPEKPGVSTTVISSNALTPLDSVQRQLLETKLEHASVQMSSQLASPRTDSSFAVTTPQDVAAKQRALFDGNTALFGKAETLSVYDSWNTPQNRMANASVGLWRPTPFAPTAAMSPLAGQFGSTWSASAVPLMQPQRMESMPMESKEKVAPALPTENDMVDDNGNASEKNGSETSDGQVRRNGKSGMSKKYDNTRTNRSSRYQSQRKSFQGSSSKGEDGEGVTEEAAADNVEADAKPATKPLRRRQPYSASAHKGKSKGRTVDGGTDADFAVADEPKPVAKRFSSHRRSSLSGKGRSKGKVENHGDDAAVGEDATQGSSPRAKRPPKKFGGGGRGRYNNGTRPPRKQADNGNAGKQQQPPPPHNSSGE